MAVKLTPKTFLLFGCMWLPHKWVLLEICHLNLCFIGWKAWSQKFPHFRMYGTQFPTKLQVTRILGSSLWWAWSSRWWIQDELSKHRSFPFLFWLLSALQRILRWASLAPFHEFCGIRILLGPTGDIAQYISVESGNRNVSSGNTLFLVGLPNIYRKRWILWDLWKCSIRRTPVSF